MLSADYTFSYSSHSQTDLSKPNLSLSFSRFWKPRLANYFSFHLHSLATQRGQPQQVFRSNSSKVHLCLVNGCKCKLNSKNHYIYIYIFILFNMPIEGMIGTIIKGLKDLGFLWPPLHLQCRIVCSLKGKIVFVKPTVTSGKWFSVFLY